MVVYVSNQTLLFWDLIFSFVTIVMLQILSHEKYGWLLWVVSALYGAFMSAVFATAFSLPTDMGYRVTPRASSAVIIGASLGDVTMPMVVGIMISSITPDMLVYSLLIIASGLVLIYYVVVYIFGKKPKNKKIEDEANIENQLDTLKEQQPLTQSQDTNKVE